MSVIFHKFAELGATLPTYKAKESPGSVKADCTFELLCARALLDCCNKIINAS